MVQTEEHERDTPVKAKVWFERAVATLLIIGAMAIFFGAEGLVTDTSSQRAGSLPPHGILLIGSAIVAMTALSWLRTSFKSGKIGSDEELPPTLQVLVPFFILVLPAILIPWLGLIGAASGAYIALLLFYRDYKWVFIVASLTVYILVIHFGLEVALQVPLPGSPFLPDPF